MSNTSGINWVEVTTANETFGSDFASRMERDGYATVEGLIPTKLIEELRTDIASAISGETLYHKKKDYRDFGMVLFCPLYGKSFIDLLEYEPFLAPVESMMGKACIVYSYTSTSMPPEKGNYATRIHNDCNHTIPDGYITKLQTLIALDDFTIENGATYVLPGSHKLPEMPDEQDFYAKAIRLTIKSGDVWYAHPKLWHAGGVNATDKWRHATTVVFCRAYMKQRIDIPRLMSGTDLTALSVRAQQKLGFFAQVPSSYEEYYSEPEQRKFKQSVE
jgi:ectoine hydroxylase-related dioxygenase (phytanoyl-CoA dioxygenase family)